MLIIIYLFILVAPMIWIPNQLIWAAMGNPDVTLECIIETMFMLTYQTILKRTLCC